MVEETHTSRLQPINRFRRARFYSPLVLNIAAEGISMSELETIPGTGQDGRVSKKIYWPTSPTGGSAPKAQAAPQIGTAAPVTVQQTLKLRLPKAEPPAAPVTYSGNVEIIEMDRMRKLIAKHMVDSKATSPHVTSFAECDVTNLVQWRQG